MRYLGEYSGISGGSSSVRPGLASPRRGSSDEESPNMMAMVPQCGFKVNRMSDKTKDLLQYAQSVIDGKAPIA